MLPKQVGGEAGVRWREHSPAPSVPCPIFLAHGDEWFLDRYIVLQSVLGKNEGILKVMQNDMCSLAIWGICTIFSASDMNSVLQMCK
jgi:hypothetical protein